MNLKRYFQRSKQAYQYALSNAEPVLLFQLHMFKRVVATILICLSLLTVYFLITEEYFNVAALLVVAVIFIAAYLLAKYKSVKFGTSLLLITVTLTTCMFMWKHEGLFEEAFFAFSGFLIFAVLVSNFALVKLLFFIMIINIFSIGLVNEYGIYTHQANASDLDSAIIISIILFMVGVSVMLAGLSIQKLLDDLVKENLNVKASNEEIRRLQNHDPLTGLPNRTMAETIFTQRIKIGSREHFETSLLFVDLDNFKQINDTYGHGAGDEVLIAVANHLKSSVRETDAVCRFGGDEFVVIAMNEQENSLQQYSPLAEKLLSALQEPLQLSQSQIAITVSIGIAVAPRNGTSFDELYKKADLAMYATKQAGRNNYQYYNEGMSNNGTRLLDIAQGLRTAIKEGELSLHFQSIQQIDSCKVVAAEALLRWQHPTLGMVLPNEFIPVAEQSGFIGGIGEWVLDKALEACKAWQQTGFEKMQVCVNVSTVQFARSNFEQTVHQALQKHDLSGEHLVLEINESLLFELEGKFQSSISAIAKLGVRFAIDDFGTGYSHLGSLNVNDFSILKIDRSFVSKLLDSRQGLAIVESIISISKSFDMSIVAVGVDTSEAQAQLTKMNCTYGQGTLWSDALEKDEFIAFLKSYKNG